MQNKNQKRLTYRCLMALVVCCMAVTAAQAAPTGYSINSDSPSGNADSLYRIDLATGEHTRIGAVQAFGILRIDVEGLAFAPDGTLYGVDDERRTLFPIDTTSGSVYTSSEVTIGDLPLGGANDVGLTFACDESLYVSSVIEQTLYKLGLDGSLDVVGAEGNLGVNISALAAFGNPVQLYGLGNGVDKNLNTDAPNLYLIDVNTGVANLVGALNLGNDYSEAGLAFDDVGQLWAITDRRALGNAPSQVMKIDKATGAASDVKTTLEIGFESLAITVPRGCQTTGNGEDALFRVQKQFVDQNDQLSSTIRMVCNGGSKLEQEITVDPNEGPLGGAEVTFTLQNFQEGETDCEIFEDVPADYEASYECFSSGTCASTETACAFEDISTDDDNLCVIRNAPQAVEITVTKQWEFVRDELILDVPAQVSLICNNVFAGDGDFPGNGDMVWTWIFDNPLDSHVALVQPMFDGGTVCRTEEMMPYSSVESTTDCPPGTPIELGDGQRTCTVTNTVFFEGIPTLSQWGMAVFVLSILGLGLAAVRRI
jgi:hypothetical protein